MSIAISSRKHETVKMAMRRRINKLKKVQEMYTHSRRQIFEKGPILKGNNLIPLGESSFRLERIPFRRDLVCRKANRKSKMSPLLK